jgi:hypothetical protein
MSVQRMERSVRRIAWMKTRRKKSSRKENENGDRKTIQEQNEERRTVRCEGINKKERKTGRREGKECEGRP